MLYLVITITFLALVFNFLNGMNDAANSIATIVSTRVLTPFAAVLWAAIFNFAAYFLFPKHEVATTMGKGIVDPTIINEYFVLAALISSIIWVYLCTNLGLPISVSHALIGGLIGPALLKGGIGSLIASGIIKVSLFIFLSPLIGMILGYFIMIFTLHLNQRKSPRKIDNFFRGMQLISSAIFSIGHGSNDAQKTMGVIAVLLFSSRAILPDWAFSGNEFYIPFWVAMASFGAISLGTLSGGWKVIKTLGVGLTDLKPVGGFCAETAGAITVIGSSLFGIPVSTTHTITGSIAGVGMTRRLSAVRWQVATNIVWAWILTIPATILLSMLIYYLIGFFVK